MTTTAHQPAPALHRPAAPAVVVRRPSRAVATRRRQMILWAPIALAGIAFMLAATPFALSVSPNGPWFLGAALAVAGSTACVLDAGKGQDR